MGIILFGDICFGVQSSYSLPTSSFVSEHFGYNGLY